MSTRTQGGACPFKMTREPLVGLWEQHTAWPGKAEGTDYPPSKATLASAKQTRAAGVKRAAYRRNPKLIKLIK